MVLGARGCLGAVSLVVCSVAACASPADVSTPDEENAIARPRNGDGTDAATATPTKGEDPVKGPAGPNGDAGDGADAASAPEAGSPPLPAGCNNGSVNPAWAGCYRTQAGAAQFLVPLPAAPVNPITLLCPADTIAIGFHGAQGDVLDHLGLICQPLALDGSLTGAAVDIGPTFGGNGGTPARVQCPVGMGMSGYTITYSGGYVDRLTPQCNLPRNRLLHGADPGSGPASPIGGSGGQTTVNQFCGPDGFVRAMVGGDGFYKTFFGVFKVLGSFAGVCGNIQKKLS